MVKPNFWECQECPHWDDVNGCWRNCKNIFDEGCEMPEEGNYNDGD